MEKALTGSGRWFDPNPSITDVWQIDVKEGNVPKDVDVELRVGDVKNDANTIQHLMQ